MRKLLLFTTYILIACITNLRGQQLSKGYLDSVQAFYNDWIVNQRDFVYTIIDNTTYPTDIDFCLYRIKFESLLDSPSIVYNLDEKRVHNKVVNDITEKRAYSIDSITLTTDEADSALAKLEESKSFSWNKNIFPNAEVIDTTQFFMRWRNTPNGVPKPGYWALSLPSFFREGSYCLMFYRYYCGQECGYEALIVYNNENGHWERFGTLS